MTILMAIFLGIVQGITEFFPISSSAHLIIMRYLFGIDINENSVAYLAFDLALHFGTFMAIIIFFFKDWVRIILSAIGINIKRISNGNEENKINNNFLWYLVLATIPGAIAGFLLEDVISVYIRDNVVIIAIILAVVGVVIYLSDKYSKSITDFNKITLKQSIVVGLSQMLAIIPGFSRSGTTMTAARIMGINREDSAKLSFFLGAPIVLGSTLAHIPDMLDAIKAGNMDLTIFLVGIITSFVIGIIAIKVLLNILKKVGFEIFAIYRIVIALVVILTFTFR